MAESDEDRPRTRIFLRGLETADYSLRDERRRIAELPRVQHEADREWKVAGDFARNRDLVLPKDGGIQSLHVHQYELGPGARSQRHGHQNDALFIVLEGHGHDVHDGERFEWSAGDVFVVTADCVHQHFNDGDGPARFLIFKGKPIYMALNLLHQETLEPPGRGVESGAFDVPIGT
ncbi:MAG: hypothetical protein QOF11_2854 [Chloroflexota bacterium]|nr:hypothetical protein [Chloroflexota bacterium]